MAIEQSPSPSENKNPDNNSAPPPDDSGQPPTPESSGEPAPTEDKPTRDEDRKKQADRVASLRKKDGAITDDEQKEIDEYEKTKRKPGRKPKWWHDQKALGIENPVEPIAGDKGKPKPTKAPAAPTVINTGGKVPKPPVFHADDTWKDKYKIGAENGRELVCTMLGHQWYTVLVAMEKQLSDIGVDTIMPVGEPEFENMLILAVDEILPDKIVATPAIIGAFATTTTVGQRFIHRKKIAEKSQSTKRQRISLVSTISKPVEDTSIPERAVDESAE